VSRVSPATTAKSSPAIAAELEQLTRAYTEHGTSILYVWIKSMFYRCVCGVIVEDVHDVVVVVLL